MATLFRRPLWHHLLLNSAQYHASGCRFTFFARGLIQRSEQTIQIPSFPTVTHFLEEKCQPYMEKKALIDVKTEQSITYGELFAKSRAFARGLRERGFHQGDVYVIMAPDAIESAVAIFGVMSVGGIYAGINHQNTKGEVVRALNMVKPTFFHTTASHAELAGEIQGSYQGLKGTIVADGSLPGCIGFHDVYVTNPSPVMPDASFDPAQQTAALCFSSGTSGLPKAVKISPANLISSICLTIAPGRWDVTCDDVYLSLFPFYHVGGLVMKLMNSLAVGATIVLMPKYDLTSYLRIIQAYQVTYLGMPPTVARQLLVDPQVDKCDLGGIRALYIGSAAVRAMLIEKIKERFPQSYVHNLYGLTECTCLTCSTIGVQAPLESVGKIHPLLECKVVNPENGNPVGADTEGEICLRGPPVMLGYLDNPEANEKAIDKEGWYHTGDIGYCDADGFLYIMDRQKDMIKCKGFSVAPGELEDLLLRHEAVADAGVIGISRDEDEHPRAYVVRKPGYDVTEEEIQKFIADNAAYYKRLRGGVRFVETLPKLASGKILRRILKDMAKEEEAAKECRGIS